MTWRWIVTLTALFGTLVAAVVAATAGGETGILGWAGRNPGTLAWTGLGTSLVAAIGAYLIMRSRATEEYRNHWRSPGH
jgi:hypothetical protein